MWDYMIKLECRVNEPGVLGQVQAWDFAADSFQGGWTNLLTSDGNKSYEFYTADHSARQTLFIRAESNQYFVSPLLCSCPPGQPRTETNEGWMILKFVHSGLTQSSGSTLRSMYDLVQVFPIHRETSPGGGESAMAKQSDTNYDGQVTTSDLASFTQAWMNGQLSADMNLDRVVDASDMTRYLAAFVSGR